MNTTKVILSFWSGIPCLCHNLTSPRHHPGNNNHHSLLPRIGERKVKWLEVIICLKQQLPNLQTPCNKKEVLIHDHFYCSTTEVLQHTTSTQHVVPSPGIHCTTLCWTHTEEANRQCALNGWIGDQNLIQKADSEAALSSPHYNQKTLPTCP